MSLPAELKKSKYYHDIFLKPMPASRKAHVLFHKARATLFKGKRPGVLALGLTYRCQLDCVHCGIKGQLQADKTDLTTQEAMDVIRQAHRLGVYFTVFFGGEPLLRKDIVDLVAFSAKEGLITALSTNSLLLTRSLITDLKHNGLTFLNISLDSPHPDGHDQLRGRAGCFAKVEEGIAGCVSGGVNVILSTYATKQNVRNGDLKKIIAFGRKTGAKGVRVLLPMPAGKWIRTPDVVMSADDKNELYRLLDPCFVYIEGVCNRLSECSVLSKKLIYVSPYGDVQPCNFMPLPFGNIRQESLAAIWARMKEHALYGFNDAPDCVMQNLKFHEKYIEVTKP